MPYEYELPNLVFSKNLWSLGKLLPVQVSADIPHIGRWTDRTRPIVRPDFQNCMVTKGYRKGVYDRVTKGIRAQ
jgi:hypothetical protein